MYINQFHNHALKVKNSGGPLDNQTWHTNNWPQLNFQNLVFVQHTTALWAAGQPSILSAKFDCPVALQNVSLLATVHDCETGLRSE